MGTEKSSTSFSKSTMWRMSLHQQQSFKPPLLCTYPRNLRVSANIVLGTVLFEIIRPTVAVYFAYRKEITHIADNRFCMDDLEELISFGSERLAACHPTERI